MLMQSPFPGGRAVLSTSLPERTVQLHLPDRGKLAGRNWSLMSLRERRLLRPLEALRAALPHLWAEGYEVISLSGGGSLLSPWLGDFLSAAKAEGFRTAATLTGGAVTARHRSVIELLDRITISFDGPEARHNAMRGNSQARVRAIAALRYLVAIGKPAEASFTVTRNTLREVPEFVDLCAALGVQAVRLHPLAQAIRLCPLVQAGAVTKTSGGLELDKADTAAFRQMAQALAATWAGRVAVRVDPTPAEVLAAQAPARDLALNGTLEHPLSDAVNPLVITPEGGLRPWTLDVSEEFDLGQLQDLAPARRIWISLCLPRLGRMLAQNLEAAKLADRGQSGLAFPCDRVLRSVKVSA